MKRAQCLLTRKQAAFALRLWATRAFDTAEIAELLRAGEAAVARTIQTARDVQRMAGAGR